MTEQPTVSGLPGLSLAHFTLLSETVMKPGEVAVQLDGTHSRLTFCVELFKPGTAGGAPFQLLTFWDGEVRASLRRREEERAEMIKLQKCEIRMLGRWRPYTGHIQTPSLLLASSGLQLGCLAQHSQSPSVAKHVFSIPEMELVTGRADPEPRYFCDHWAICAEGAVGPDAVLVELSPGGITLPLTAPSVAG